jgi:hypothetical protein
MVKRLLAIAFIFCCTSIARLILGGLQFVVNGQPSALVMEKETAYVPFEAMPNQSVRVQVTYRSQGLDSWKYSFGQDVNPVENFHLRMTTNFRS